MSSPTVAVVLGLLGYGAVGAMLAACAFGWRVGAWARRPAVAGWAVLALVTLVDAVARRSPASASSPQGYAPTLVRLALLAGLACFLPDLIGDRPRRWSRLLAGGFVVAIAVAMLAPGLSGVGSPTVGATLSVVLLVALTAWSAALVIVVAPLLAASTGEHGRLVLDLLRRTRTVLGWSVAAVVVLAGLRLGAWPATGTGASAGALAVTAVALLVVVLVSVSTRRRARRIAFTSAFHQVLAGSSTPSSVTAPAAVATGARRRLTLELTAAAAVFVTLVALQPPG